MRIVRDHGKSRQAAREMADMLLPALLERHGDRLTDPQGAWDGDVFSFSFRAMGFSIKGTLEIDDARLVLDAGLPLLARPFEGTLRANVESELDRILAE